MPMPQHDANFSVFFIDSCVLFGILENLPQKVCICQLCLLLCVVTVQSHLLLQFNLLLQRHTRHKTQPKQQQTDVFISPFEQFSYPYHCGVHFLHTSLWCIEWQRSKVVVVVVK